MLQNIMIAIALAWLCSACAPYKVTAERGATMISIHDNDVTVIYPGEVESVQINGIDMTIKKKEPSK